MLRGLAKGAVWMVAFRFAERSLGVISTIVLARLLMPADFGLIAMAMTFVGLIELIGAFGFDNALIQRKTLERSHYDSAFTLNALLGVLCGALIAIAAWPAADFYSEPRLVPVMLCLAVSSVIQGIENVGTVDFRRGLDFQREFTFLTTKRLVAFLLTMIAAFALRSYWALAIGIIAGRVAAVALSYWLHPYRPRFTLVAARGLMSFSGWLLAANVLTFFSVRFSHFIIGRGGNSRALGLYTMSYEIATLPTSELLAPINRAVFPAMSRVSHDLAELRRGFLAMIGAATLVTMPAAFGIAAIAEPLVLVGLSAKWTDSIVLIEILAFLGAAGAMINCTTPAYLAIGKPHIGALLFGARLAVTIPFLIIAGSRYGVIGIAWVELLSLVLTVPVSIAIVSRVIGIGVVPYLARAWRALLAATAMYFVVRHFIGFAESHGLQVDSLAMLLTSMGVGALTYPAFIIVLWALSGRPDGIENDLLRLARQKLADRRLAGKPT